MGIRLACPNGHKLHVKAFLAGKRGICPKCGAAFVIPTTTNGKTADSPILKSSVAVVSSSAVEFVPAKTTEPLLSEVQPAPAPAAAATPPAEPPELELRLVDDASPGVPTELTPDTRSPDVLSSEASSLAAVYVAKRRRGNHTQMVVAVWLFAMVVVLAGLLIWVLTRNSGAGSATRGDPQPQGLVEIFQSSQLAAASWERGPTP